MGYATVTRASVSQYPQRPDYRLDNQGISRHTTKARDFFSRTL